MTEFQGLTVMTETPLVLVDVQRGGPSTGLPTRGEQGDLLAALYAAPGDAPRVVMAPRSVEECYQIMPLDRRIAEEYRVLVIVLSDANLAAAYQIFRRPEINPEMFEPSAEADTVPAAIKPFAWDPATGLSRRILPGQPNGMWVATGLNHTSHGQIAYSADSRIRGMTMRSRKIAVLQSRLSLPSVFGDPAGGDLLLVGWGSTCGAIYEAVTRARAAGLCVSALGIRFLNPLPPGLREIFGKFRQVMTVELNYTDDPAEQYITSANRRYGQLATILRQHTLVDVDCRGRVTGHPLRPIDVDQIIRKTLGCFTAENPGEVLDGCRS